MYCASKLCFLFVVMVGGATAGVVGVGGIGSIVGSDISFAHQRPRIAPGGLGGEQPADAETQQLLDGVRVDVEAELGRQVDEFTVVSYSTQVVSGRNYFAKVRIGTNEYIHIRVYHQSWTDTLALHGVQVDKTLEDPVNYF